MYYVMYAHTDSFQPAGAHLRCFTELTRAGVCKAQAYVEITLLMLQRSQRRHVCI